MSRQASPGPAGPNQQTSYYRDAHGLPIEKPGPQIKIVYRGADQQNAQNQSQSQGAPTPVPVATSSSTGRSKSRAYQSGIAAGAEDVKYAAKYRDLKQKVKEIEADNDRLVFKVLQAKRNIQRAKLERAILYERLGALPASPPQGNAPLPIQHTVQQQVPPGGQVPRHVEPQPYGQSSRHQRAAGPLTPHHHHRQHHQQPIQPAPPSHVSPPQHHATAHHPHHPPHDAAHPGQLPITHAQQVTRVQTAEGPLPVVAGPDGRPVMTADGHYIPAQDIHPPPPPPGTHTRKRGGRVSKEVREMREREAREIREREEMERKQALIAGSASSGAALQAAVAPQAMPMEREREREWEVEREIRERERIQRREGHEDEPERHGHRMHHHAHRHGHGHHHHHETAERERERASSPPPPPDPDVPSGRISPSPLAHRSQSQLSHSSYASSYRSHHSYHIHSHSHSASPLSPGGTRYPATRIHNHQRIGPGSYVLRDRSGPDVPPAELSTPTPVPVTPSQNDESSTNAPTPTASGTAAGGGGGGAPTLRVPTPPYIQRGGRADVFDDHADPDAEPPSGPGAKAKNEAAPQPSEEGSAAQSTVSTPP